MNGTVLILDDSMTVRMDIAEAFQCAGMHATPCATAAEARAVLTRHPFDVIIIDVLLPDGDGVDFLHEVRSDPTNSRAAILMLSSEAAVKDRIRGLTTGADAYVGKPYDVGYVVAKARDLIRSRSRPAVATTTVLVVDDSATVREHLRAALEAQAYHVVVAADGEEGLRLAAAQRPDVAIIDSSLPDIDGGTVIRRLRFDAALRSTPCLLLTGSQEQDAEVKAFEAGADAFVRKEQDAAVILATLAALLRRSVPVPGSDATTSLLDPKKILVVDDSLTFLNETADRLRREGYDAIPVRSGEEALELLEIEKVDCILLDLIMPGLNGQETCRKVKETSGLRDVPLIMLTGRDDREAMLDALSAGADDYITKSGEFVVLIARIRAQLRRKQLEDESRRIREELLHREIEATEARAASRLAETRAALVSELELKNRELEAFSYSVSHDLRAPLRGIDGFSRMLLADHADQLDDTGRHYLARLREAATRMGELIDDLLALSRVSTGELHRDQIDLSAMVRHIIATMAEAEPDRDVAARVQGDLVTYADARLLKAALENLLGNAWKFTARKSGATVEFGMEERDGAEVYLVRDNGDGFDMAKADRLFTPFQRLHSQAEFSGTGIGLATVHRIVARHGGRIWAEATAGDGATFRFTLPR